MNEEINILILSCGTRNKIVQYFKQTLKGKGKVIATDCSELAPALYEADKYFIVPPMTDASYLDTILKICKENKVKSVFSLIDPELSLLAKNKQKFMDIGVLPIVSDSEMVDICFDKYRMYQYLKDRKIKTVKSYIDRFEFYKDIKSGVIQYPVFVKPVNGSASVNISKADSKEEIDVLFERHNNLMIQEYMDGSEYGVDVYIDLFTEEPVSIFIKEKLKMRGGETDKSLSVKDDELFGIVSSFVRESGFKGIIDIDVFKKNDEYYISEVNPRFGGGYPHAYECGVNIPKKIINNILGNTNDVSIGKYKAGTYMIKYSEISFLSND